MNNLKRKNTIYKNAYLHTPTITILTLASWNRLNMKYVATIQKKLI